MGFAVNGELPGGDKIINSLYQPLLCEKVGSCHFPPLKTQCPGRPYPICLPGSWCLFTQQRTGQVQQERGALQMQMGHWT